MESKTYKQLLEASTFFIVVAVLILTLVMPVDAALPPRPPRPHATPTASLTTKVNVSSAVDGGFIRLVVVNLHPTFSAVVQWQDVAGNWHSVTGWQNKLSRKSVKWWVNSKDFGKGPFRWMVYEQSPDNIIAVSDMFFLPSSEQHIVDVYMTLK